MSQLSIGGSPKAFKTSTTSVIKLSGGKAGGGGEQPSPVPSPPVTPADRNDSQDAAQEPATKVPVILVAEASIARQDEAPVTVTAIPKVEPMPETPGERRELDKELFQEMANIPIMTLSAVPNPGAKSVTVYPSNKMNRDIQRAGLSRAVITNAQVAQTMTLPVNNATLQFSVKGGLPLVGASIVAGPTLSDKATITSVPSPVIQSKMQPGMPQVLKNICATSGAIQRVQLAKAAPGLSKAKDVGNQKSAPQRMQIGNGASVQRINSSQKLQQQQAIFNNQKVSLANHKIQLLGSAQVQPKMHVMTQKTVNNAPKPASPVSHKSQIPGLVQGSLQQLKPLADVTLQKSQTLMTSGIKNVVKSRSAPKVGVQGKQQVQITPMQQVTQAKLIAANAATKIGSMMPISKAPMMPKMPQQQMVLRLAPTGKALMQNMGKGSAQQVPTQHGMHRNATPQPVMIIQQQQNLLTAQSSQKSPGGIKTIPAQKLSQRNHAPKPLNPMKAQSPAMPTPVGQKSIKTLLPQQQIGGQIPGMNKGVKAQAMMQIGRQAGGQVKTLGPVKMELTEIK